MLESNLLPDMETIISRKCIRYSLLRDFFNTEKLSGFLDKDYLVDVINVCHPIVVEEGNHIKLDLHIDIIRRE